MNFIKRNKAFFIAPALVMLLLGIAFAVKGIYPFGDRTIAYYDMPICYVPLYTHTYDVLHGSAPALLDWYNAASCDFTQNSGTYLLNPFNIIFLFTSRDNIVNVMSYMLLIKLMFSALTMTFYLKRKHHTGDTETVLMSVLYTFCGFMLQNYMNIFFLDIMIMFPLLMLSLDHLIKTRKGMPYLIAAFFTMYLNLYISAMVFIYVILYVFGYMLFIDRRKEARCQIAADLGLYTFLACLIVFGLAYPGLVTTANSPRSDYTITFKDMLLTRTGDFDEEKLFMLFGCEFGIAALILTLIKLRQKKQKTDPQTRFSIYLLVLLIIPIIFEGSNLMWHFSSYAHFPYRFGFILAFTGVDILAGFLSEWKSDEPFIKPVKKGAVKAAEYGSILFSAAALIALAIIASLLKDSALEDLTTVGIYKIALPLLIISGIMALGFCNKKMRTGLFAVVVCAQALLGCYGFIAPSRDNYLYNVWASDIHNDLDFERDNLSRIKQDKNESLRWNHPLLTGIPGLSDWTLNPTADYAKEITRLGYAHSYTEIYDLGGTIFSDALLNVKMIFNNEPIEENELYKYKQTIDGINFYECTYKLPFGILADNDLSAIPESGEISPFEVQNNIFHALSDGGDIFTYQSVEELGAEPREDVIPNILLPFTYTFNIKVTGNALIYAHTLDEEMAFSFIANEDPKNFADNTNAASKVAAMNGHCEAVPIGTFCDETVQITMLTKNAEIDKLFIGVLDLDKFKAMCDKYAEGSHATDVKAEGTELTMKVDDPNGRWLFLPIEYSKNWKATINGESAEVVPVMDGTFVGLKLGNEDADIKLKFVPELQYKCLLITAGGILLLAFVQFMRKKGHYIADTKVFSNAAGVIFPLAAAGILIVFYAAPVIGNIISIFI